MTVYVLAPVNRMSGGAELAHQMCHAINELTDVDSRMCYVDVSAPFDKALCTDVEAPKAYELYETSHVTDFEEMDQSGNVVVFPEGLTLSMRYVTKAKKVLWWMSVDNYIASTNESNLPYISDNVTLHLYQSYYAKEYVEKKIKNPKGMFLSDYINEEHGKFIYPAEYREDIALYNPAKGYEDIKPLIDKADWLKWVPLSGLDVPHMVLMMQSSKVYVDFGNHPGKDRIPREAASNGCCVITNKKGAAANDRDVPIPEKYKFSNTQESLDEINELLHDICDNCKAHQKDFDDYRKMIREEKNRFIKDIGTFVDTVINA